MKIALACNNFPPEFEGGTERVTLALARALTGLGHDVIVVTGSEAPHDGEDAVLEEGLGLRVYRIRRHSDEGYGLELQRPRVLAVVESILAEHESEVLHLHHWATLSIGMLRAARRRGLRTVATLHDMWAACPRFFRRPPEGVTCPDGDYREPCGRCAKLSLDPVPLWGLRVGVANRDDEIQGELAAAGALCVPSASSARKIAAHVPWRGPIEVVPHGLLEPTTRQVDAAATPQRPMRIGTFGNLVNEKGVGILVEAMAGLNGAELHLHGPFLEAEFEREVVARAERGKVHLHCHGPFAAQGPHPARELDLAVFPSLCEESYGLVVEEALARGVPVIVSDLGALSERVGEGGVVTPAGDAGALREVLAQILADPERHAALRQGIPGRFSTIEDAARRYLELYAGAAVTPGADASCHDTPSRTS